MIVMKFGGTSVGTGERIANSATLAGKAATKMGTPPVVVVSAMAGVTSALREAATRAAAGDAQSYTRIRAELEVRHLEAISVCVPDSELARSLRAEIQLLFDGFEQLCHSIHTLGELTDRGMDAVSGTGERLSARLLAAAMRCQGYPAQMVEATEVIVTDANYGNALPLLEETGVRARARLLPLIEQGIAPVVTGFIGATRDGVMTTLGRGSGDFSATIIGRSLRADEVWIWTDVNGVMTADPRIVPEAQTLPSISYHEVAELSFFGAKVLHPLTIQPVAELNIPVRVLNSFNPEHPGTLITTEQVPEPLVKGITAIRDLSIVTVAGRGMQGVPGVAGRVFTAVAGCGASILMITQSSSEQSICFLIRQQDTAAVVAYVEEELALEMMRGDIDSVDHQDGVSIVAVVGSGMRGHPGIGARVFGALGEEGVNVIAIAQGSSECNMSLVLANGDVDRAVRAVHRQFDLHKIEGVSA
ncbi:MAG: aspartate kinase [Anaerolineales bacterium]